jgi:hypothetical protein
MCTIDTEISGVWRVTTEDFNIDFRHGFLIRE